MTPEEFAIREAWTFHETPIATVDDAKIIGRHDTDGTPFIVYVEGESWDVTVDETGALTLQVDGIDDIIEVPASMRQALIAALTHPAIDQALPLAVAWDAGRIPFLPPDRTKA